MFDPRRGGVSCEGGQWSLRRERERMADSGPPVGRGWGRVVGKATLWEASLPNAGGSRGWGIVALILLSIAVSTVPVPFYLAFLAPLIGRENEAVG